MNNNKLFNRAKKVIPGGVNSPVRAFKSVGGNPLFISAAKGAYLYDIKGKKYLDLINSWGPMILGHQHPKIYKKIKKAVRKSTSFGAPCKSEVEMAELIVAMVPSIEKVRMVNSGTEATMSAIRVARAFTGKDKIIKFEGCYHGHGDAFLVAAGSGAMTLGVSDSSGVTKGAIQDTFMARYNDIESVKKILDKHKSEVGTIIVEPVAGNMGCVVPEPLFLQNLREICDENNMVLIFDEVMTGFRLARGGAQEKYGVTPDMTTLGKIIGGGLPVGAYGGKKEIMDWVAPLGSVYQAGTLSGNPISMAAGLAQLKYLNKHPKVYDRLDEMGMKIRNKLNDFETEHIKIQGVGSMFTVFFSTESVVDYQTAKKCDTTLYAQYFHHMLAQGIYLAPSQFESLFLSHALHSKDIHKIIEKHKKAVSKLDFKKS